MFYYYFVLISKYSKLTIWFKKTFAYFEPEVLNMKLSNIKASGEFEVCCILSDLLSTEWHWNAHVV